MNTVASKSSVAQLCVAYNESEMYFVYQPIFNVAIHKPFAYEALLRCGTLPVSEILSTLSTDNQRSAHWLFTLTKTMEHLAASGTKAKLSINCEQPDIIEPWFVSHIFEAISKTGISPEQIIIELTEHSGSFDMIETSRCLKLLRNAGISVALDDFGMKHANFDAFCFLPIDEVKIDMKFVWNIENVRCARIVEAMVIIAEKTGINLIAEGVHTRNQVRNLSTLGIKYMQGFYFSPGLKEIEGKDLITKVYGESISSTHKNNVAIINATAETRGISQ